MSIRESTYRTTFKETLPATDIKTHRKNQYSFASPFRNSETKEEKLSTMKFRSPLRDQQIQDYNRIKSQLKRGLEMAKENISMNHLSQYVPIQQYNILNQQHRYETERLLMEIQKLHETIGQVQRAKNYEIQRVKQEYQAAAFLNMSNVRQVNASQVDLLQGQLRKLKEQLNDKSSEYQNTIKRQQREIKHLKNENVRLNAQIKTLIQQKNTQLQNHQRSSTESFNNLTQQYEKKLKDLQESHNRDIAQLNRIIEQNEVRLKQQLGFNQNIESQNAKLYAQMQDKRIQALKKELDLENESREKYAEIKRSLQQQFEQSYEEIQKNYETKQQILENEILKLKQFLKQKNEDRQKLIELHQERLNFVNQMKEEIERQNQQLKDKLKEITNKHLQQQELLKVKMATLHQTDLTILVKTYEDKIENHVAQIKDRQDTISRLRTNLYEETNHRYEMRKKYSIEVSKLNAKVIKLRSGLHAMQTDFKEKIENERSMMLLTSQNMIKEVESKTSGNKFYQTQLRKLQQLFDFHQKQTNADDYQVEERIRIATQELHRLSAKVLQQKNSHIETQKTYKSIVQAKDQQISKLQHQLDNFQHPELDNSKQIKLIEELKTEIHDKNLQNGKLKDQLDLLQKKIHIMNQQLDQYHMEHEITQQQAKKQYQKIANQNMEQFKVFYENRIQSLEREKEDLKELISSKQEKITSLVQKYQQLQKTMKSTLSKIKKRTDLQNLVVNIGLDNNLVKNMAEIVKNDMAS